MSKEDLIHYNSETGSKAGKKSKRGKALKTIIEEISAIEYPTPKSLKAIFKKSKYTGKELMIMAQMAKTYKGDTYAFNAIADRLEGKPKQTVDTTITEKNKLPDGLTKAQLLKLAKLNAKQ